MECLDENMAVEFVEGALTPELTLEIEAHLAECGDCRALLVSASRSDPIARPSARAAERGRAGDPSSEDPVTSDHTRSRYLETAAPSVESSGGHKRRSVTGGAFDLSRERRRRGRGARSAPSMTLEQLFAKGSVSVEHALWLLEQIGDQLRSAHRQGLFHRDLKPSGIVLGRGGAPRVLGLDLTPDADVREGGKMTGATPAGLPSGERPSRRSEIFLYGAVAYRLLGGKQPYEADKEALNAVPKRFRPVLARCLDPVPANRFGSVRAVMSALRDAQGPSTWYVKSPMVGKISAVIGGVCVLLVLVGLVFSRGTGEEGGASSGGGGQASSSGGNSGPATSFASGAKSAGGATGPARGGTGAGSAAGGERKTLGESSGPQAPKLGEGQGGPRGESVADMGTRLSILEQDLKTHDLLGKDGRMCERLVDDAKQALRQNDALSAQQALKQLEEKLMVSRANRVSLNLERVASLARTIQLDPEGSRMLSDAFAQVRVALQSGDMEGASQHLDRIQQALLNRK